MFRNFFFGLLAAFAIVYALNSSWLATPPSSDDPKLISHRGVHQTYDRTDLGRDECTATRIFPPEHNFQENTLPSMAMAFGTGADVVEIDIHPTTDGHFAVFHDWTVECRTDGNGVTRQLSLEELQKLDIGHGYTADNGKTFPFRGRFKGQMPSLSQVFARFPGEHFLINFKSKDPAEADRLMTLLQSHPDWQKRVWGVYGGEEPTTQMAGHLPDIRAFTKKSVKTCLKSYIALGWSGFVPEACRQTQLFVPSNYAVWLWGWPNRFLQRMKDNGTEVILSGPPGGSGGIDTLAQLALVPDRFSGYIWTNKIETIGPALREKWATPKE